MGMREEEEEEEEETETIAAHTVVNDDTSVRCDFPPGCSS